MQPLSTLRERASSFRELGEATGRDELACGLEDPVIGMPTEPVVVPKNSQVQSKRLNQRCQLIEVQGALSGRRADEVREPAGPQPDSHVLPSKVRPRGGVAVLRSPIERECETPIKQLPIA